jgi:hypothetical protein
MGNAKNELKHYNNDMIKENEIIKMVETSLTESYEEIVEEEEEASILSSLRAQDIIQNIDKEEELEISKRFNLEPIIIIDNVDLSILEEQCNECDDDDDSDFNIEDLVNEFAL